MFSAYIVIAILVSAVMLFSAIALVTRQKQVLKQMDGLRVPLRLLPLLAAAEIAGSFGLITGIWYGPLAIAAAIGVVAYFIGAVAADVRVSDYKDAIPAAVLVFAAAALIGLRAVTF